MLSKFGVLPPGFEGSETTARCASFSTDASSMDYFYRLYFIFNPFNVENVRNMTDDTKLLDGFQMRVFQKRHEASNGHRGTNSQVGVHDSTVSV